MTWLTFGQLLKPGLRLVLTWGACVFLPVSHILQATFLPSSTIGLHQSLLSPRSKKVATELRRGQPVQGHLDGGRACLLATRVSRSVRLSVCEAVIRFQDFPNVTGLLTSRTPLCMETTATSTTWPSHPNPWAATTQQAGAAVTCNHTQNLSTHSEKMLIWNLLNVKSSFYVTLRRLHPVHTSCCLFLSLWLTSLSLSLPSQSPLPTPSPLDGRSGSELCGLRGGKDAAVHINNERPQPPPPDTHTHTHTPPIAMAMALAQHCHRGGSREYSYALQVSAHQADHKLVHKPTILGLPPRIFSN